MTTPIMSVPSVAWRFATCMFWVWCFTLLVSMAFTFNTELHRERLKYSNDSWLRARCKEPEFYINMKEHTDLCATVEDAPNAWLKALNATVSTTHLCGGSISCTDRFQGFVQRLGWQIVGILVLVALFSPNLAYLLYRSSSSKYLHDHEGAWRGAGRIPRHSDIGWSPYYPPLQCDDVSGLRARPIKQQPQYDP